MITQAKLMELLSYEPETGVFRWLVSGKGRNSSGIAGNIDHHGYHKIVIMGIEYKTHRLSWLYVYGNWPDDQIDHINLVRHDNRIANLREATRSENMGNKLKYCNNRSGHKGVSLAKRGKKWRSSIKINGKVINLGSFDELSDAASAYERAAKEHFGQFARVA